MVRNVHIEEVDAAPRPLIALGHDYPDGFRLAPHRHRRGQLISGATGVLVLATPQGRWVMPPGQGLWIPPGILHEVRMIGPVSTQSLYLEPAQAGVLPERCQVVGLSGFVRSLMARALDVPADYEPDSHAGALMALLLHELRALPVLPLSLPFPADPRLAERCRSFLARPTTHETIEQWSEPLGLGRRTFTRLFRRETGLSFVEWRQQACLVAALPRLVAGEPVTTVALDLGYDNPAAFTTMFKRVLGAPPRAYLKRNG
ncbi:transcriptional regulator, AraC family [Tistlia consotensis]|uniref:Transcriptional regulator, AraC family n=1 Tax=Tistlia consotensis USBA 355 TaxID=560819 RepID=A0A1Y6BR70_9PROT|nr:helix-turn-helix transcriptional regulator [Tistlia consotensis]SMF23986.1 transcriptional regulator, AraC family [Tistlia consotensis USBA 355]SNR61035.1 transcriptional regulator, AraC family [Tistlia consotensis]